MILGNNAIQEAFLNGLVISPFYEARLQACGYDLTLGEWFAIWNKEHNGWKLDTYHDLCLNPGDFILAHTQEYLDLGPYAGTLGTTSTAARHGLDVHGSSSFIEPGYRGKLTLEIGNRSNQAIILMPGMVIAHIRFEEVDNCSKLYHGQYQNTWKPASMLPKPLKQI